jgi:hypothetical protein
MPNSEANCDWARNKHNPMKVIKGQIKISTANQKMLKSEWIAAPRV